MPFPYIQIFFISGNNWTVNGCVRAQGGSRAFSSQLGASDFDANNLLPLMTEEKQCVGFNTGSKSEPRSCVVGGPLSLSRGTIAAAAAATESRELQGQHRSSVSRSRGAGGYVGSYGNSIDPIKMHAHQNLLVMHFLKPLRSSELSRSPFSSLDMRFVILTQSILKSLHMFRIFNAPAAND